MNRRWHLRANPLVLTLVLIVLAGTNCPGGMGGGLFGGDGYEPDNHTSQAKTINAGEPQTHSIFPPDDSDFVTFTLAVTSPVTIEVSTGGLALRLFDRYFNFIAFNDGSDNDGVARIVREGNNALGAGTYYIKVTGLSGLGVAGYELTASFSEQAGGGGFTLSGAVRQVDGTGIAGVTMTAGSQTTTTDDAGNYAFSGMVAGPTNVSAALDGYSFFPQSVQVTVVASDVPNVNFVGYQDAAFSFMQATTDNGGLASFNVNGTTARVKAVDIRTGNTLAGITAVLLTDGTDGVYGLFDGSGLFLPRVAGGFSAPGGPVNRTIDETATIPLVGSLALSGQQVDAVTTDSIPESLWPYVLTLLGNAQSTAERFHLDSAIGLVNGSSFTTAVQFMAEQSIDAAAGLIPLSVMAFNLGTTLGDTAWNKFYESRGYGSADDFDILIPSATLQPLLPNDLRVALVVPRAMTIGTTPSAGGISGKIIDSTTAAPLPNVAVTVYPFGTVTQTDASGNYSFSSLPVFGADGSPYWLSATMNGYDPDFRLVTVQVGETTTANIPLNPILAADVAFRIVLEWNENPRDVDSHIWTPAGDHIYYANRGTLAAVPFVNLDVDDVSSYGPETITIKQISAGTYTYALYHFAGSGTLATSGSRVKVYDQTGPIRLFIVPSGGSERWWEVFKIDGSTGAITTINTLQDDPPIPF